MQEDRPQRRHPRLHEYDYGQDGVYFVTICTHKRSHLFGEIEGDARVGAHLRVRPHRPDRLVEEWLFELERKFPETHLDAYVIMPNHIHFLLRKETPPGAHIGAPLPEIVKWFKTQTTNAYIRAVKAGSYPPFDQHIWQRNYYEHVVRSEADYLAIWQYIAENPLKWELDKYHS